MPPKWHSVFLSKEDKSSNSRGVRRARPAQARVTPIEADVIQHGYEESALSLAANSLIARKSRHYFQHVNSIDRLLRKRELGVANIQKAIRDQQLRQLKPWRSWTGASKDILSVAWGSDSTFAIGASTDHSCAEDIPYNKPNNLLFGTAVLDQTTLQQLSGHTLPFPNSTLNDARVYTPDSILYMTVSHVTFAHHSPILYSSSYDRTVRVWDVNGPQHGPPECQQILYHDTPVDIVSQMLTSSCGDIKILATAQQDRENAISVYVSESEERFLTEPISLTSPRAFRHHIFPSAIQWGTHPRNREYLLAGFSQNSDDYMEREGNVCLWDVSINKQIDLLSVSENVFDVTWAPGRNIIAAATTSRNAKNLSYGKLTRSVIRTWSPFEGPSPIRELECPALDINEVLFHPHNDSYILASCTDGRTYIWDQRRDDRIVMALEHDEAVEMLDHERRAEEDDVGVRFTSWSNDARYLYTGSSDGRIGCWNISLSSEDALVQEVAKFDSCIMSGAFSPDGTKLLVGTAKGSVEILSIGVTTPEEVDANTSINPHGKFGPLDSVPEQDVSQSHETVQKEGIEEARRLIITKQIINDPNFGPGQGPTYQGPWCLEARAARSMGSDFERLALHPAYAAQQFDERIRREGQMLGGKTAETSDAARWSAYRATKERHVRQEGPDRARRAADICDECPSPPCSDYSLESLDWDDRLIDDRLIDGSLASPKSDDGDDSRIKRPNLRGRPILTQARSDTPKRSLPPDFDTVMPKRKRERDEASMNKSHLAPDSKSLDVVDVENYEFSGILSQGAPQSPITKTTSDTNSKTRQARHEAHHNSANALQAAVEKLAGSFAFFGNETTLPRGNSASISHSKALGTHIRSPHEVATDATSPTVALRPARKA